MLQEKVLHDYSFVCRANKWSGGETLESGYMYGVLRIHMRLTCPGLPRTGKNILKIQFFPGQEKVREFGGWPGKFRKDLASQGSQGL